MATLKIQGIENALGDQGYLTSPAGLTVNAYLASSFPLTPTPASFSPRQTPVATATTASDGSASLTGLGASSYAVCIIDLGGQPHFFVFPASYPGDGITHVCRYIPTPHVAASTALGESFMLAANASGFNVPDSGAFVTPTITSFSSAGSDISLSASQFNLATNGVYLAEMRVHGTFLGTPSGGIEIVVLDGSATPIKAHRAATIPGDTSMDILLVCTFIWKGAGAGFSFELRQDEPPVSGGDNFSVGSFNFEVDAVRVV